MQSGPHFLVFRFIPSDRTSKDFICYQQVLNFLFLFSFLFLIMSSDSALDDILAADELLSVSNSSPPSTSGVPRTPFSRTAPRMGGGFEYVS